jgi:hypothetical protein
VVELDPASQRAAAVEAGAVVEIDQPGAQVGQGGGAVGQLVGGGAAPLVDHLQQALGEDVPTDRSTVRPAHRSTADARWSSRGDMGALEQLCGHGAMQPPGDRHGSAVVVPT